MAASRPRISVCIVCRNESEKLDACLESAAWADEVLVMDLESVDGSAEIARRRGATVIVREPIPIVEPLRNELAGRASGEWILALDPDERVSPGLGRELRRLSGRDDLDAVEIPFTHQDFGHRPSHRNNRYDPKPRFYRRERVSWPAEPNRLPSLDGGRVHRLPDRDDLVIIHERNRTIPEALDRVMRYAPAEAQALIDRGETFTAQKMIRHLARRAHRHFIDRRAFDDGVPGLMRAAVIFAFDFYVWAAFWQMSGGRRTADDDRYVKRIGSVVYLAWGGFRAARAPIRAARALRGRRGSAP